MKPLKNTLSNLSFTANSSILSATRGIVIVGYELKFKPQIDAKLKLRDL
jgi:hypothetical protein